MSTIVHGFDWPDRFVVGTVGEPGERIFFLQARAGSDVMSVSLEKEQSAALAERLEEVLDSLMAEDGNPFSIPAITPEPLVDAEPLEQPVVEQFRAGMMSLGWDPSTAQIVIEAFPMPVADDDAPGDVPNLGPDAVPEAGETDPAEVFVVRIPVGAARAFAKRTREVVESGRPICTLCNVPMDDGHVCTLPDDFQ